MALETAWNRFDTILISDGGRDTNMAAEPKPPTDWARHSARLIELLYRQISDLRNWQVAAAFKSKVRRGGLCSVRTAIGDYGLSDALDCPAEQTAELARHAYEPQFAVRRVARAFDQLGLCGMRRGPAPSLLPCRAAPRRLPLSAIRGVAGSRERGAGSRKCMPGTMYAWSWLTCRHSTQYSVLGTRYSVLGTQYSADPCEGNYPGDGIMK